MNYVIVKRSSKVFEYSFLKNGILEFLSNAFFDEKLRKLSLILKVVLLKILNSDSVGVEQIDFKN